MKSIQYQAIEKEEKAVNESLVELAGTLINDAFHGVPSQVPLDSPVSRAANRLRNRLFSGLSQYALMALVLLTFFESAVWCGNDDTPSCDDPRFPSSGLPDLNKKDGLVVEGLLLAVVVVDLLLLVVKFGLAGCLQSTLRLAHVVLVCCMLADYGMAWVLAGRVLPRAAPYLRIVLTCLSMPDFRQEFSTIFRLIPRIVEVLMVVVILIFFYSWFGCILFDSHSEAEDTESDMYFPNLLDGMWNMLVLLTTANYPDVMMPAYNKNRLSFLFFLSFLVLGLWFMMNLLLATVFSEYSTAKAQSRDQMQEVQRANLDQAFAVLDTSSRGWLDQPTIQYLLMEISSYSTVKAMTEEEAANMFTTLDEDGNGQVDQEEFRHMMEVFREKVEEEMEKPTFMDLWFPGIVASRWFQNLKAVVSSEAFEHTIDAVLVLNMCTVWIESWDEIVGNVVEEAADAAQTEKLLGGLENIFMVIYVAEMILKWLALGFQPYWSDFKNQFDGFITLASAMAALYVALPNGFDNMNLIKYMLMVRLLRLIRVLMLIPRFQIISETFVRVIPAAYRLFGALFSIMFAFSALGVLIMGGRITIDPESPDYKALLETDFAGDEYWANNFNDMVSGMVVLFELLIVNNWFVIVDGFVAVVGRWVAWYFIVFYVFGVCIALNLVVSFILDAFDAIEQEVRKDKEENHS